MAEEYGDKVDYYATINEPMVYIAGTYLLGIYPGGETLNLPHLREGYANMAFAHAAAVAAIREADTIDADGDGYPVRIVLVQAISPTTPADPNNEADLAAARRYDYFYNRSLFNVWVKGDLDLDFDGEITSPPRRLRKAITPNWPTPATSSASTITAATSSSPSKAPCRRSMRCPA